MSPERAAALLEESAYHQVREAIALCCIFTFEQRLALELAARGARGRDILIPARALIASAFRRLADECEAGWQCAGDDSLRRAYLDAIGAELADSG
ncbi:MAG: hypothetical protein KF773_07730 [Deltaproteobacteria bacterium]|nr:hypothetical protein [Deltaproteobacteria bacterium]